MPRRLPVLGTLLAARADYLIAGGQDLLALASKPDALPAPDVLATEIADDLETALEQFTKIAARLKTKEREGQR